MLTDHERLEESLKWARWRIERLEARAEYADRLAQCVSALQNWMSHRRYAHLRKSAGFLELQKALQSFQDAVR